MIRLLPVMFLLSSSYAVLFAGSSLVKLTSYEQLRAEFNAQHGSVRLISQLSPT